MKSANRFKKFRKITAAVLCLAMVLTSFGAFGDVLKNKVVYAADANTFYSKNGTTVSSSKYQYTTGNGNGNGVKFKLCINYKSNDIESVSYRTTTEVNGNCITGETFTFNSEVYDVTSVSANGQNVSTTKNADGSVSFTTNVNDNNDVRIYVTNKKYVLSASLFDYDQNTVNTNSQLIFSNTAGSVPYNKCDGYGFIDGTPGSAVQGIVQDTLSNGFPVFNMRTNDLFDPYDSTYKMVKYASNSADKQVGVEFIKDEKGYYILDSDAHSYTYNESKGILEYGEYPNGGFWPFGGSNFYFGMALNVNFNINADGKTNGEDTVFEFSGDDDVWVFIDGKLVLDMGGIHKRVNGSLNFAQDTAWISNVYDANNSSAPSQTKTLSNLLGYTGTDSKDQMLEDLSVGSHTLSIFYLERGASASNCKIKFNFSQAASSVPTDVFFEKVDENNKALAGAKFGLFKSESDTTPLYTAVSTSATEKNVYFKNVKAGTYVLKEIEAPEGYKLKTNVYHVNVVNGTSQFNAQGQYVTTNGSFIITDANNNAVREISNKLDKNPGDILGVDKTAKLDNWDDRTYTINLDAWSKDSHTTVTKDHVKADIVLVLDVSGSMAEVVKVGKYKDIKNSLDRSATYCNEYGTEYSWKNNNTELSGINGNSNPTIYMTRLELVKQNVRAFISSVKEQSPESKIAIVTYSSDDYSNTGKNVVSDLKNVGEKYSELITATNSINEADGGTKPSLGLTEAKTILDKVSNDGLTKFVVLFTDGEPTGNNTAPAGSNPAWDYTEVKTAGNVAESIKNAGTTIYTIGYGLTDSASDWLANGYKYTESYNVTEYQTKYEYICGHDEGICYHYPFDLHYHTHSESCKRYYPEPVTVTKQREVLSPAIASTGCAKNAGNVSDLNTIFREISESITEGLGVDNVTVRDYITDQFVVIDEENVPLADGSSVAGGTLHITDKETYIEWTNQTINYPDSSKGVEGWKKSFKIKAKDSYLGGNAVLTNGPLSGLYLEDDGFLKFPQPMVNVKASLVTGNTSDEIFLGETLEDYFTNAQLNKLFTATGADVSDVTITYSWKEDGKPGSLAAFAEYVKKQDPTTTTEYRLTVKMSPKVSGEDAEKTSVAMSGVDSYVVGDLTSDGVYTVTVITGELVIEKQLLQSYLSNLGYTDAEKKAIDAVQTVVFTVDRYDVDDLSKPAESIEVAVVTDASGKGSVKLTGLRKGIYKVTEKNDWSWKYTQFGETQITDLDRPSVRENSAITKSENRVFIGKKTEGTGRVTYKSFKYYFENTFADPSNSNNIFSDTTNVLNVFKKTS